MPCAKSLSVCTLSFSILDPGMPLTCREGQEGKSLQMAPGTRNVKEILLNLLHKVKGQADKKLSISLNAGEMIVLKRLCEVSSFIQSVIQNAFRQALRHNQLLQCRSGQSCHQAFVPACEQLDHLPSMQSVVHLCSCCQAGCCCVMPLACCHILYCVLPFQDVQLSFPFCRSM